MVYQPPAPKKKPPPPADRPQGGLPGADPLSAGLTAAPPDPLALMMGGGPPGSPMPPTLPPGAPRPGQTMDPMMAMMGGMPKVPGMGLPPPPPPPGAPLGPGGLPVGGTPPAIDPDAAGDMGGSPLLQGLAAALGDPYSAGPEGHADLRGIGAQDPSMGLDQLIQLIAMASSGAGPPAPTDALDVMPGGPMGPGRMGVRPGGSGVPFDRGLPGQVY